MTNPGNLPDRVTLKDIEAWAGGVADAETIALVKQSLDDPHGHARQYVDWLKDPRAYQRQHGGPPALVAQKLAALSPETRAALLRINEDNTAGTPAGHAEAEPSAKGRGEVPGEHKNPSSQGREQGPDRFIGPDARGKSR